MDAFARPRLPEIDSIIKLAHDVSRIYERSEMGRQASCLTILNLEQQVAHLEQENAELKEKLRQFTKDFT